MIKTENIMNMITTVIQPNSKTLLFILVIFILLFQFLEIKMLIIISLIFTVLINYDNFMKVMGDIKKKETTNERIIENNVRTKKEIYFDSNLDKIIQKLKKYRKYNQNSHDEGYKNIKMFSFIIHDLEKDDIAHPKQYFENAQIYLNNSLNNYQSISISVPEENFINTLKYNKYNSSKLANKIGKLCKQLHKHCFYLLFNLSKRFNIDWKDNPDIYKNEITINSQNVKSFDNIDYNWNYY